jgi:iron complex transport system ATP-binding protein|tara:strand:+ start:1893 stop:2666 length:774 start_codon:yes stop_codon:yes gene_type:complete
MSISAKSISLNLGGKKILKDISIEVPSGEILSIIGPNGAGKTSLLNVLSGNLNAYNGLVSYNNIPLNNISIQERAYTRAVMSQFQSIAFDYSVRDILEMGWLDYNFERIQEDLISFQQEIIEECDIQNLIDQKFNTLSGGEQRRVHFARALIQLWQPLNTEDQKYLLLDEPFSNLDLVHKVKMMNSIKKRASSGTGVLMILHDLNLAYSFSDKIVILKNGKLVEKGKTKNMLSAKLLARAYETFISIDDNPINIRYY